MNEPPLRSCLYFGSVFHRRTVGVQHRFRFRLPWFYLDLDELPRLHRCLHLFGFNAPNLIAFHDRDHIDNRAVSTRDKVGRYLAAHGIDLSGGAIFLLTQTRVLHYVFNPISFHFCHGADGGLRAIVAEVNNTFGERFLYLLSDANRLPSNGACVRYRSPKAMHVSPFLSRDGAYEFSFHPVGSRLAVAICTSEHGAPALVTTLTGVRYPLSDRNLARVLLRQPLITHRVMAAIHWQALRLYRKGARFHPQPSASNAQQAQQQLLRRVAPETTP